MIDEDATVGLDAKVANDVAIAPLDAVTTAVTVPSESAPRNDEAKNQSTVQPIVSPNSTTPTSTTPTYTTRARTRRGNNVLFNCDPSTVRAFGFYSGDRVLTPKGSATVLGVSEGDLYFLLDTDKGASKWSGYGKHQFQNHGFVVEMSPYRAAVNASKADQPDLSELVNNEARSDVAFLLDNGSKVFAQRGILTVRSSYFDAMLNADLQEKSLDVIPLSSVSEDSLIQVMYYLYTGEIEDTKTDILDLLRTADHFVMEKLVVKCVDLLMETMTIDTALISLEYAHASKLERLKQLCFTYINQNFDRIPKDKLGEFISTHPFLGVEVMTYLNDVAKQKTKKRKRPTGDQAARQANRRQIMGAPVPGDGGVHQVGMRLANRAYDGGSISIL